MITWNYLGLVLLQSSALSLIGLMLLRCFRNHAANRHAIAVTTLSLVMLSPIASLFLPDNWSQNTTEAISSPATPRPVELAETDIQAVRSPVESFHSESATAPSEVSYSSVIPTMEPTAATPVARTEIPKPEVALPKSEPPFVSSQITQPIDWNWFALLTVCCLWLTGASYWVVRYIRANWVLARLANNTQAVDQTQLSESIRSAVCKTLGLKQLPEIRVCETLPAPVVLGLFRPRVIVPSSTLTGFAEHQVISVLVHECAHIRRGDSWLLLSQHLTRVIWWFHPLVIRVSGELTKAREEICDNYAIRQTEVSDFAQTLLVMTQRCATTHSALSTLGLFGQQWGLEDRIKGLLNPGRNKMVKAERSWTAVALIALCLVCGTIGGVSVAQQQQATQDKSQAETRPVNPEQEDAGPAATTQETKDTNLKQTHFDLSGACIVEETGKPISARIRVFHQGSDENVLLAEFTTDENGKFEFKDLVVENLFGMPYLQVLVVGNASNDSITFQHIVQAPSEPIVLNFTNQPLGTLSGKIVDQQSNPIAGAQVFVNFTAYPITDFMSAVSDENGNYEIKNMREWDPQAERASQSQQAKHGSFSITTAVGFSIIHPDYPRITEFYSAVPQTVDVTVPTPARVAGQVVDMETGQNLADVEVCAQGIGLSGWEKTRTDENGRYALSLTPDYYNIWAVVEGKMPIAIKALEAKAGHRLTGHDIRIVQGGFVKGRFLTQNGEVAKTEPQLARQVGHHGPARPGIGSAVTSAAIDDEGRFTIQVAPGKNYIYTMDEQQASIEVNVGNGQTIEKNIIQGIKEGTANPDVGLQTRILKEMRPYRFTPAPAKELDAFKATRIRPNNQIGKLLDQLEEMCQSDRHRFSEPWAHTIYELASIGPEATSELSKELDVTQDPAMIRSLAFIMRAIDDKKAIPALIRSIPKTLLPASSDLGLRIEDNEKLLTFLQIHDLDNQYRPNSYDVGRPIREVFGALEKLSGMKYGEEELYHIDEGGTSHQMKLKREQFQRIADDWKNWWENTGWKIHDAPIAFSNVNNLTFPQFSDHFTTPSFHVGWTLTPIDVQADYRCSFVDLDTGRTSSGKPEWEKASNEGREIPLQEMIEWAKSEGMDVMGDYYRNENGEAVYAIRMLDCQAWQLPDSSWKTVDYQSSPSALKQEGKQVDGDWLIKHDQKQTVQPNDHAPFLLVTKEGTPLLVKLGVPVTELYTAADIGKPVDHSVDPQLRVIGTHFGRNFGFSPLDPAK